MAYLPDPQSAKLMSFLINLFYQQGKSQLRIGYSPRSSTFLALKKAEAEGCGFFKAKNVELQGF